MTTETLTDKMIRALRWEARQSGDVVTRHACGMALGEEEPILDLDDWEERYGGGGYSAEDRKDVMAIRTRHAALQNCAEVINDARSKDDSTPFVQVVP